MSWSGIGSENVCVRASSQSNEPESRGLLIRSLTLTTSMTPSGFFSAKTAWLSFFSEWKCALERTTSRGAYRGMKLVRMGGC